MEEKKIMVKEKITEFFKKSVSYFGKEIALETNQHFSIDQVCDEEKEQEGEYNYHIQYGFPQSGCISMNYSYSNEDNSFSIDEIIIYAPSVEKELMLATFAPEMQYDAVGISMNVGIDNETQEHKDFNSIISNPNALKMLDIAINDLNQAEVLGECKIAVPMGSDLIPCTYSTHKIKKQR